MNFLLAIRQRLKEERGICVGNENLAWIFAAVVGLEFLNTIGDRFGWNEEEIKEIEKSKFRYQALITTVDDLYGPEGFGENEENFCSCCGGRTTGGLAVNR